MGQRFFFVPKHPDRLWGPSRLLFSGFFGGAVSPGDKAARA